jgi:hypothetical protein
MQTFGLGCEFGVVTDGMTTCPAELYIPYLAWVATLFVLAPIFTFGFVLSLFKNLSAYIKYLRYYFRDVYVFSELNEKSLILAEDIKNHDGRAVVVFTDVYETDEEQSCEQIEAARQLGAIRFKKDVLVINFIDMLSHARTESRMVRELASDERAYRSITASWFKNSPVRELFRELAKLDVKIVVTTDHGSIRVNNPVKVIGDKNTNTNLRYKLGKNLSYNQKQVFELKNPKAVFLPAPNISTTYIFAQNEDFFAYPNNYNYYVGYYKNTFQHGGISMEEMLVPLVTMQSKRRK